MTTAPIPTNTLSPILRPSLIALLGPIQQFFPISTLAYFSAVVIKVPSQPIRYVQYVPDHLIYIISITVSPKLPEAMVFEAPISTLLPINTEP